MSQHSDEQDKAEKEARHAAPEGAERHPLIDLSRDPHPGVPDHGKPDDQDRRD